MTQVIRIEHHSELAKNTVALQWSLTNSCNYSCSYCSSFLHDGSYKGPSLENIEIILKKFKNQFPHKHLFVELTGGECTVYKDFLPLLDLLNRYDIKVSILTNGSRKLSFYESIIDKLDKVILSFHPEQAEEDHFYELVKLLAPKVSLHINILMLPEKFNQLTKFAQKLAGLNPGLSIAMQRVGKWPESKIDEKLLNYNKKQNLVLDHQMINRNETPIVSLVENNEFRSHMLKVFNDGSTKPVESNYNEINAWIGWKCFTGIENFVIQLDGQIYRGMCQAGGPIGNMETGEINFPNTPILCPMNQCGCGFDILCTKIRS